MQKYIGTPTSRIDGIAKVTGDAKYAADFNVPGLAHLSVVCATIARGRITRIDSAATRVKGVLAVLTHENRPSMADNDAAYKDEVAPDGSPYRPLYDGKILFDGQPIALVAAETSENPHPPRRWSTWNTKRSRTPQTYTASVMRPCRSEPTSPQEAAFAPPKRRGNPEQALAVAAVRHQANTMCRSSTTTRWNSIPRR